MAMPLAGGPDQGVALPKTRTGPGDERFSEILTVRTGVQIPGEWPPQGRGQNLPAACILKSAYGFQPGEPLTAE